MQQPAVEVEHAPGLVGLVVGEAVSEAGLGVLQVGVLDPARDQKTPPHDVDHAGARRRCDQVGTQPLGHVRVAVGPGEDLVEPRGRVALGARDRGQAGGEGVEVSAGEVLQTDRSSDVKRRPIGIGDEVAGRGHAEQAEREALVVQALAAAIVQRAHRGEEVIARERQRQRRIDLVDEHHHLALDMAQHVLFKIARKSVDRAQAGVALPEFVGLVEAELTGDLGREAVIPVGDGGVLGADAGEVDADTRQAIAAQAPGGAHAQARLAHLAAGEHVAKLAAGERGGQLVVGRALDIYCVLAERAAGLEALQLAAHGFTSLL